MMMMMMMMPPILPLEVSAESQDHSLFDPSILEPILLLLEKLHYLCSLVSIASTVRHEVAIGYISHILIHFLLNTREEVEEPWRQANCYHLLHSIENNDLEGFVGSCHLLIMVVRERE